MEQKWVTISTIITIILIQSSFWIYYYDLNYIYIALYIAILIPIVIFWLWIIDKFYGFGLFHKDEWNA